MRKLFILCLVFAWSMTGCYEDKGDYNYRNLANGTISNVNGAYNVTVGDTLIIEPEITFDIETNVGLKYEWSVELDSVFSREKNIEYIIPLDAPEEMRWVLQVTDTLSGLTFMTQTMIRVSSLYSDGFLILSEKNGISSLSFIKRKDEEWNKCYYDIYENIEGVPLDGKPVQIHLHDLGNQTDEHVMLLQDDFYKCIDMDAANLEKSLDLSQEFQMIPENIRPKQVFFDDWFSFLLAEDGRIFSRKNFSSEAFHTGYFSQFPMVYMESDGVGGEIAHQLNVDRFVYDMNTENGYVFVYEKEKKRFLYIRGASSYGTIGEPKCAGYPNGFIPIDNLGNNDLIATSGYWWNDYYLPAGGLYNIIKCADGSYVGQMLQTDDPDNIVAESQRKFKGDMMNDGILLLIPDNGHGRGFGCPYAFIASGNILYYFGKDVEGDIIPERYFSFPAEITAIEDEYYSNEYLCVGLANGEVYLLKINSEGFASDEEGRLVMKMDQNVGTVKQIIHKRAE